MTCPKCGAQKMVRDDPIYFNNRNHEGDSLFFEEIYRCQICGKVVFFNKKLDLPAKQFIKGQVITRGYESL
jgi:uncharacterized Zn finger protein